MPIGGLVAVIMIIISGYMWMIAAGDPQKTKQAQGTITWTVIGLMVLAGLRLILELVLEFLQT